MKKMLFFIANLFLYSGSIFAQKDTMMWFAGHWADSKTFIIESNMSGQAGGNSGKVNIQANGGVKVTTPENKKWNEKIDDQIKEIEKSEEDIKADIRKEQGLIQYNLGKETVKELENIKQQIKTYKAESSDEKQGDQLLAQKNKDFAAALNKWCVQAKADFDEVMNFYRAHKKTKNEHFDLPVPPEANYQCWSCDKKQRIDFEKKSGDYVDSFFNEESKLITKALNICRTLQLLGRGENSNTSTGDDGIAQATEDAFHHSKTDPAKNGPCYGINESDLWEAVLFLAKRGMAKTEQLLKENKTNYAMLNPVIRVYLGAQRTAQLLGINVDQNNLKDLGDIMLKFYYHEKDKLIREKDYSQMANIPFMLGLLQQALILDNNSAVNSENEIKELRNFCHFKITIDMDTKIGKGGGYTLAHLKGTAKVVAELDSVKCIKFVLDKEEQAKIHMDVVANEIIAPGPHPVYIGTKKAESPMPFIDLHFCTEGNDSIYIYHFVPANMDKGLWMVPSGPPAAMWINGLDGLFQDSRQLAADAEALANDYKGDGSKVAAMKQNADALKQKALAMQRSGMAPSQMAAEIKKLMNQGEQQTQQPMGRLAELKFPVKLYTGNKVLINEKFDAKTINTDAAPVIIYGYLSIMLEHDPKK